MTKNIKIIVRSIKKRFETLYRVLESKEDREDVLDIMDYIDEKLED